MLIGFAYRSEGTSPIVGVGGAAQAGEFVFECCKIACGGSLMENEFTCDFCGGCFHCACVVTNAHEYSALLRNQRCVDCEPDCALSAGDVIRLRVDGGAKGDFRVTKALGTDVELTPVEGGALLRKQIAGNGLLVNSMTIVIAVCRVLLWEVYKLQRR